MNHTGDRPERIILLAPQGRDAPAMTGVMTEAGLACFVADSLGGLVAALDSGAGAAVVAEEALRGGDLRQLADWLEQQPSWSDFPLIVLVSAQAGRTQDTPAVRLQELGNLVLLERPLHAQTLTSAATSALRARRRQYQARDVLAEQVRTAASLRDSRAELLALNDTLESRIVDRTRALAQANDRLMNEVIERERAQQALVQFQKMEAVGRLTGGIAHDFNNLLNVIQTSMDLILFMSSDEQAKRKAEVARRACERGGKLTSQLLAFSRNQRLDLRATGVAQLFDNVRELMRTSLGATIGLDFVIAPQVGSVMADMNQMEMALLNLAINARDAMPDGGALSVRAALATPPAGLLPEGDYCVIAVADNGAGIAADILAKVFEPFFTTKEVGKGTGLGLSQVYGMAQQSGGTARAVSEPGRGTTVEIWLRAVARDSVEAVAPVAAPAALSKRHASILVVEDDNFVRQSMVETLEVLGYRVAQAADGEAGLTELRRSRPDLMITDYLMPGMTGAELVSVANGEFPGLPMIIATGYADMQAIDDVIGDNTVLRKPFHLIELAASVDRALRRSDATATQ